MDRHERAEFRKRVEATRDALVRVQQQRPGLAPLVGQFLPQLEALLGWTEKGKEPDPDLLDRITVGHVALRELGESPEECPPELIKVRQDLLDIQSDVMSYYAPFP